MLKEIKSIYILKFCFSHINKYEKTLEIIRYNKKLQKRLDINIHIYKRFSGRYIKYETKEKLKGKEYNSYNNSLIYEGEYINLKKNGKGKEYNEYGKLIFKGIYLKGKKWIGKVLDYYFNGRIKFEGEYLNGKINGKGYDNYHMVIYEINDGIGLVRECDNNNILLFEGQYINGKRHGKGKEGFFQQTFEGEYYEGKKWNGTGYIYNKAIYELKNGNGYIKEYCDNILIFEGEYSNGLKNGKGREYFGNRALIQQKEKLNKLKIKDNENKETNILFEGEYLNGYRLKGKEYNIDDVLIFEGEYFKGHKFKGREFFPNGKLEYEGEYLFDKKWNGKGYDEKGKVIYELINGNGKVKEYKNGKLIFEGEYLNGERNGKGKEYVNGILIYDGDYLNGYRKKGK